MRKILKPSIILISVLFWFWPLFTLAQGITLNPPLSNCVGSAAQVNLNWVSTIPGTPDYYVLRKIKGEAGFVQLNGTPIKDTFYVDTTVESDKIYIYKIKGVKGVDTYFSSEEEVAAAYCPPVLFPPITSCQADGPHINLSWSSVSGDLLTYEIFRDGIKIRPTTDTTFSDGPDIEGTKTYNYYIRAVWGDGTFKDSGAAPVSAPACPPTLNVSSDCLVAVPGGPKVNLSWNSLLGVKEYQIYRNPQGLGESLIATTTIISYTDNLVESLPTYGEDGQIVYRIVARWPGGEQEESSKTISMPRCEPFLTVNSYCQSCDDCFPRYPEMSLSWTATLGVDHYNIYRDGVFLCQTGASCLDEAGNIIPATSAFYFDGSPCGDELECSRTYRIDAVAGAETLPSEPVTKNADCSKIEPPSPAPILDPLDAYCDEGDSIIKVSWSPSNNVLYYGIYRNGEHIIDVRDLFFEDSGIEWGFEYTYYVVAFGQGGQNTISENAQTFVAYNCTPPSASTITTPLSTGCEVGKPYIIIFWSSTTNTYGYEIWRATSSPVVFSLLIAFDKTAPEFTSRAWIDTSVSPSTAYYYRVVSKGPPGVPSTNSANTPGVTTPSCMPWWPSLTLNTTCEGGNPAVTLSWTSGGVNTARYEIFRENPPLQEIFYPADPEFTSRIWKDTSVSPLTTYRYKVDAVGFLETQRTSSGYQLITTYNCTPPTPFTLSEPNIYCQNSYVWADLSWTPSTNTTSYDLYEYRFSNGAIAETSISYGATSPFTDKGFGNALSFAWGDYVRVPDSSSLRIANQITIEAWVYRAPGSSGWQTIISKTGSSLDLYFVINSGNLYLGLRPLTGASYQSTGIFIPEGVWTQVALTYDGSTLKVFKNGQPSWSKIVAGILGLSSNSQPLYIGYNTFYGGEYWQGKIDQVRIYNRALTDPEIQEHYQGIYNNESGLRGLWHFDEDAAGQTASDGSNYGNNGTRGSGTGAEASDPAWVKNGPQCETKYNWQIKANSPGGSTFSNTTTPAIMPLCPPAKPGLVLKPLCDEEDPLVNISFSFSINAARYEIYREDKGLIGTTAQTVEPSLRTLNDTDVISSTTYTYYVKAIGPTGLITESDHLNVTTLNCIKPTKPENLTASSTCNQAGNSYPRVILTWKDSENTATYTVFRDGGALSPSIPDTDSPTYTFIDDWPSVQVNATYTYYVIAYGPAGASPPSDSVTIKTGYCTPSKQTITLLTTDCKDFVPINTIKWEDPTTFNTFVYKIYRATSTVAPGVPIIEIASTTPEFSSRTWKDDSGLLDLTQYYYWVKAVGPAGEGPLSDPLSVTTYGCGLIPGVPTLNLVGVSCFENAPQVTLNWNAVSNAYSYNLYRGNPDLSTSTYSTRIPVSNFIDRGSYALDFDGVNDYVNIPISNSLKPTTTISVEAWIYPSFPDVGWGNLGVANNINGTSDNYLYVSYGGGVGNVFVRFRIGTNWASRSVAVGNNTWTHIVAVYDGTKLLLYKNGVAGAPFSVSGGVSTDFSSIKIGERSGSYFKGKIDEFRIYGRALSAAEIQKHLQGIYENEADLRGVWHFDEGSGTNVLDNSGKGNNGTMINMDAAICWARPFGETGFVLPLENEKLYKYQVRAFSVGRGGDFSNEVSLITPNCLPAKPDLKVEQKCIEAKPYLSLSWQPDPNTNRWFVYKRRAGVPPPPFANATDTALTSYLDSNVESGITYEYYVEAFGKGVSTLSDIVSKETPFCHFPPYGGVPFPITATTTCQGYSSRILIDWDEDLTGNTLSYNVWKATTTLGLTGPSEIYTSLPASITKYLDSVAESEKYIYKIEAVGSGEANTLFSNTSTEVTAYECSKIPPFPPFVYLNFAAPFAVSMGWTDSGNEEEYEVFRKLEAEPAFDYSSPLVTLWAGIDYIDDGSNINYVDLTTVEDTTYNYQVRATNKNGATYSNIITVYVPIAPPAGFILSGSWVEGEKIHLTWTEASTTVVGGPVTYEVRRSSSVDFVTSTNTCTVICGGPICPVVPTDCGCDQPRECDDDDPTALERFYRATATNRGGTTYSNIFKVGLPIPIWQEVAP